MDGKAEIVPISRVQKKAICVGAQRKFGTSEGPPPDLAVSVLLPIIASLRHGEDGGRVNQWEQLPKEK